MVLRLVRGLLLSLIHIYIADVFDTLIVRDIRKKYKIRNMQLMDRLVDFLMDNISNLTSARSIKNAFRGAQEKVNHVTISAYMQYPVSYTHLVCLFASQ